MKNAIIIPTHIARHLQSVHPDVAERCVDKSEAWIDDLDAVTNMFSSFCAFSDLSVQKLTGPVHKFELNDKRKVFLCASIILFNGKRGLQVTISRATGQWTSEISHNVSEVLARYARDERFTNQVDKALQIFKKDHNDN